MTTSLDSTLNVLIEPEAHRYAMMFAAEQASPAKGKQVYLNTLAVYAVRTYLNWLSVPADLSGSDCWHRGLRAMFDVADLVVPGVGKLECRPILPDDQEMLVLPRAEGKRLGYVAVRLSEDLQQAELLGFIPAKSLDRRDIEAIPLNQIQPLEDAIQALHVVNLKSWLEQIFTEEWLPPMQVIGLASLKVSSEAMRHLEEPTESDHMPSRSHSVNSSEISVSRGKSLQFADSDEAIAIVLTLTNNPEGESNIQAKFLPGGDLTVLPQGLEVLLLDAAGNVHAKATAQEEDTRIQIAFGVGSGEEFSLQLTLNGQTILEKFQF